MIMTAVLDWLSKAPRLYWGKMISCWLFSLRWLWAPPIWGNITWLCDGLGKGYYLFPLKPHPELSPFLNGLALGR